MLKNILRRGSNLFAVLLILLAPLSINFEKVFAVDGLEYVTLSSFNGKPGKTIQVWGGGYTPNKYVIIYTSESNSVLAETNSVGDFGPVNLTIPVNTPQGNLTITSAINDGSLSEKATNSYYVEPFTPSITVDSSSNLPFSNVTVSGTGFSNGEEVELKLATATSTVTADSNGEFENANLVIPNVASGLYNLVATGISSNSSTLSYFYIGGFYPNIYPSSYYILPDETLSFGGSGYANGEEIKVYEDLNPTVLATFNADSNGSFESAGGFIVPFSYAGSQKTFKLVGTNSGGSSTVNVTIGQFNPNVYPSAYYITPGQSLSFSGSGFAKNETITVFEGETSNVLSTIEADEFGSFESTGAFEIPFEWGGTNKSFRLVGQNSNAQATTSIGIGQFYPNASPSEYYIMPGKKINFTGNGFAPGETVDVLEGLSTTPLASFVTDENGNFENSGEITVPFNEAGETKVFKLFGRTSKGQVEVSFTVGQLYPQISPSTYYLKPGQIFTVSGFGFAEGETVSLKVGDLTPVMNELDDEGNIIFTDLELPFDNSETIDLVATGNLSGAQAIVTLTVAKYYPYVGATNYYVMPGTEIGFTGEGFAPNEDVNVQLGLNTILTLTTDENGSIETNSYVVPFGSTESLTFLLTGQKSKAANTVTIGIGSFYPWVVSSNYYTQPGTVVTISGGGFAANEDVKVVAGSFTTTSQTDMDGNLENVEVTLPFGHNSSSLDIVLTGLESMASGSTTITLAPFNLQITPSTYYAQPGSQVDFTGSGFVADEGISIKVNDSALTTVNANSLGEFELTGLTLPFGTSAVYTFTGSVSGAVGTVEIGLASFYAGIELSSYYATGGTPVTISGSGFYAGENIAITFGGASLGNVTATSSGSFALNTNVPYSTPGSKAVIATGSMSGASAETTFTQAEVYTSVELGNYAGGPGTSISFIGSGFLANEPIEILTDRTGSTVVHTFNASAAGAFNNSSFVIPNDFAEGELTLTIKGTYSMTTSQIVFYVTP